MSPCQESGVDVNDPSHGGLDSASGQSVLAVAYDLAGVAASDATHARHSQRYESMTPS